MHSFYPTPTRGIGNPPKINDFRAPSTGAPTRRTLRNAYLSMVSEGAYSPAGSAAAKKEPPSGTHESLGLLEHGRPRKSIRRWYVLAMRTRRARKSETEERERDEGRAARGRRRNTRDEEHTR